MESWVTNSTTRETATRETATDVRPARNCDVLKIGPENPRRQHPHWNPTIGGKSRPVKAARATRRLLDKLVLRARFEQQREDRRSDSTPSRCLPTASRWPTRGQRPPGSWPRSSRPNPAVPDGNQDGSSHLGRQSRSSRWCELIRPRLGKIPRFRAATGGPSHPQRSLHDPGKHFPAVATHRPSDMTAEWCRGWIHLQHLLPRTDGLFD